MCTLTHEETARLVAEWDKAKRELDVILTKHTARKMKMRAKYQELWLETQALKPAGFRAGIARRVAQVATEQRKELAREVERLRARIAELESK